MSHQKDDKNMQLAAIDIGSNAIRLIIGEKTETGSLRILKKYREPIRLGAEVFNGGVLSAQIIEQTANAFVQFRGVIDQFQIQKVKAVATSALRDAENKKQLIDLVYEKSKVQIQVITGMEEARLIHSAVQHHIDISKNTVLLIDIGGGSVELTISKNGKPIQSKSFQIGTVRTLDQMRRLKISEQHINLVLSDYMQEILEFMNYSDHIDFAIGTGGNFECMGDLKHLILKKEPKTHLSYLELDEIKMHLKKTTIPDRIEKLKLRPDRADVILIATKITQLILRQAEIQKLIIPYVGLREGILWSMLKN